MIMAINIAIESGFPPAELQLLHETHPAEQV
jgi:hypothetical protein